MYPHLTHSPIDAPSGGRSAHTKTYRLGLVTLPAFSLVAATLTLRPPPQS
jgi:hypothetical protein